jgi:co-chaperonin GroES (HSP10)
MAFEHRMIKNSLGDEYQRVAYEGTNTSGYEPLGDRVLVLCDEVMEKSAGGIIIVEELKARMQMSAETGMIIEVGPSAFEWNADRMRPFGGPKPVPGTRVYFDRYAGTLMEGVDGRTYRMMDDKHIAGKEKPPAFQRRSQDQ